MVLRCPVRVVLPGLLFAVLIPAQLVPAPATNPSSLRATVEGIHCATNPLEAELHLRTLQQHSLLPPGLPNEAGPNEADPIKADPIKVNNEQSPHLRATTLDRVLLTLFETTRKFPEHKMLVEQAVVQWNFCSVIDNDTIYDHRVVNGRTEKYPSALADIHDWSGFRRFGLMPDSRDSDTFSFSTPYTNTTIKTLADRKLQQRYIDHCLPHPDNKQLYRDFGRNFISRIFSTAKIRSPLSEFEWKLECPVDKPVITENTEPLKDQPTNLPGTTEFKTGITEVTSPPLAAAHSHSVETLVASTATEPPAPDIVQTTEPEQQTSLHKPEKQVPVSVVVPNPAYESGVEKTEPDAIDLSVASTPIVVTGPWSGVGTASAGSTSKGFSGSISVNNSAFLSRNTSLNFAVSYKPLRDSYWFIRSALNISQESKPLTYSWGIGYDDWHPGTWAIQLNHWGPLQPGDGLDIKNAVAELSYKFKSPWLERRNLSSSVSLTKPLSSNPAMNLGWSWNPRTHWFIRSTLIKPLGESGLDWSYGFGYTRYNNKSLSLEYNNWGPNEFPDFNFKKNALISLIYRWAF